MRQIKDTLTQESSEIAEINKKIEKILAIIEKDTTSNTGPEASSNDHHPKPTTKTTKSTPHKPAVAKIEETPTIQHET